MSYEHSLTVAAQEEIDNYIARQTAQASAALDRLRTAFELVDFLEDERTLLTPGFVLRRHIQARGLVSGKDCADLSQTGNVPWPREEVYRAAAELSSISNRDHGLAVSTSNWEKYLSDDMNQGIQRDMIFKLAVITGMGREETMELLRACGQAPYNIKRPLELLCWYCQCVPGIYTWRGVQDLLRRFQTYSADASARAKGRPHPQKEEERPEEGTTKLLSSSVEGILGSSLPAAEAERELMEVMVKHCGQLKGFSRTAQSSLMRLTEYLKALYVPDGRDSLQKLISAMFQAQGWNFDDVCQSSHGKRYVFRGEGEEEGMPRREYCVFDRARGDIALFCKRYYARACALRRGSEGVDRRDVLLLGYFLITGYQAGTPAERDGFWALTEGGAPLDRRMARLRENLEAMAGAEDMKEKQVLCCRIFNGLFEEFGFLPLYVPAPFDRLILLSLLNDQPAWTMRYLMWEEVEE